MFSRKPVLLTQRTLVVVLIAVTASCSAADPELSAAEAQLVSELGFDQALMTDVLASGEHFEQLMGTTEDFDAVPVDALVLLTKPGRGYEALEEIRDVLAGSSYAAYMNDNAFGFDNDKVAIIRSTDEYDFLALVRTDGINYDVEHEQVLAQYREWDELYDLALVGAGLDWLEAEIGVPPESWGAFAEEVYRFCPDVVDQGAGTVKALASEMRRSSTLYLWWD